METITTHGVNGAARESTGLIESLVERIGGRARTATIYGDPVERDGVTVVPVARAMWGCGGGTGRDDEQQMGSGEGGGMLLTPVGYIGIQGGSSSFRPDLQAADRSHRLGRRHPARPCPSPASAVMRRCA